MKIDLQADQRKASRQSRASSIGGMILLCVSALGALLDWKVVHYFAFAVGMPLFALSGILSMQARMMAEINRLRNRLARMEELASHAAPVADNAAPVGPAPQEPNADP